jgi:hypothetical protein
MLQCTGVCRQHKIDSTYFVLACPFPFLLVNIIVTIAEITVLGRQISTFCLDGRETGAEKVKKGRGRGRGGEETRKNFDPAERLHHHAPKTSRVASRCHATAHECKRRLSALFLLVWYRHELEKPSHRICLFAGLCLCSVLCVLSVCVQTVTMDCGIQPSRKSCWKLTEGQK